MKHSTYTAPRKRFPVFLFILIGTVLVAGTATASPSASVTFQYNLGGSARYGMIDNGKLYCVIGSRLFIADVADATRPVEQGSLSLPGIGRRISKKGTVLYVACTEGGMVTVDVSDPQNPKQLAQIIFLINPTDSAKPLTLPFRAAMPTSQTIQVFML